ncbi:hypothetical protein C1I98_34515 [Spongiactinospora gelatinilytica]|uniref:NlpC/P60 domain-containing protein n=1 Tax=Spongiactinospora gelatinilytica TaxID=2666298 RepID=A0A2W2GFF2_9ACTN|nr:NlpC/P60 family protein [Spongiactinospora gelatinilytica]PZG25584.1 hypothetical protein C1I98_34515 [Spongiactinospora gelatinilytica]
MMISPGFVWTQVAAVGSAMWLHVPVDPAPTAADPYVTVMPYESHAWTEAHAAGEAAQAERTARREARRARGRLAATAALSMMGMPFSWGGGSAEGATRGIGRGSGTVGFDCSGLALYAWAQAGVRIAHYTGTQYRQGRRVREKRLRPGDLVFFGERRGDPDHVGLYVDDGVMVHAPQTGDVVRKTDYLASPYYSRRYRGAVRPGLRPVVPPLGPPLWHKAETGPAPAPMPEQTSPEPISPTEDAGAANIRPGPDDGFAAGNVSRSDERPDGLRDGPSAGQGQPATRGGPAAR